MSLGPGGTVDAFVGIGSNLGDPVARVERACELLRALPDSELSKQSSPYRSSPFGPISQPDFVNVVVKLRTGLAATALLFELQDIERMQGRLRKERWGPRTLDLDLLLYGDQVIQLPRLTVPHPGIGCRNFVLLPLREIEPGLTIPGLGRLSNLEIDETTPAIARLPQEE